MKYIVIFALLSVLYISFLFFENEFGKRDKNTTLTRVIPEVKIVKEIDFTISKDRYETIFFNGDFNDTESAKGFLELFSNYKVVLKFC